MSWERGRRLRGQRPGDTRVRIARRREQQVEVRRREVRRPAQPSVLYLVGGFALLIALGTILLLLPISTRAEGSTDWHVALFTATSAVCVTGLAVTDTYDTWTTFGQAVILALIQLGGLGFMTSATLLFMFLGRKLSLSQRLVMADTLGRLGNLPMGTLVRRIVIATLLLEALGAILLVGVFATSDGELTGLTVWRGVFTSVSAFNNAGFDIEGGYRSLIDYRGNVGVVVVVAALITLGGTGYAIWSDVWLRRRWGRFALDTKIALSTSAVLVVVGTVTIFIFESIEGGVFVGAPRWTGALDAFSMSVSARTAGFTVIDLAQANETTRIMLIGLMFIGGASVSTAGGIKLTTFTVLLFAILASLRGSDHITAFGRSVSHTVVFRALSVALLAVAVVFALTTGLTMLTDAPLSDVSFESTSAFGTVGLSTGLTPDLSVPARLLIIVGMFVGRLGPLTVALALAGRHHERQLVRYPEESVSIG
jgi:trk system potassium uptake protein TrkH